MKNITKFLMGGLLYLNFLSPVFGLENAFYILRNQTSKGVTTPKTSERSLKDHVKNIHILISQAYHVNEAGKVSGVVDQTTLNFAKQNQTKVMALVTNAGFDQQKLHQFLIHPTAQKKAIQAILKIVQQYHFYGVQFDFEMIALKDKKALTKFYLAAAKALHSNGLVVSFAIVPGAVEEESSAFLKRKYKNWTGAYDLKALAKSADFITIMAYDQHTTGTTPGPTASVRWVESVINYTLQFIPASKISLGIPVYSGYWSTTSNQRGKISVNLYDINYQEVTTLLNKHHAKLQWNNKDKINYSVYEHAWLNDYIFAEDAQSFKAKLELAKIHHLRGISVFSLGYEDPQIWQVLAKA